MNKYVRIMRLDHWIKQLFIFPGVLFAILLLERDVIDLPELVVRLLIGFFATCLIASANYVINEFLDAQFDKFHPEKKHRAVVEEGADKRIVYLLWGGLTLVGLVLGWMVSVPVFLMLLFLWVMGILYNVKPVRTKDLPYLDVLSESVNNAIRLLIGWFIVTSTFLPPVSLIIGYWMGGAFLMATKRFSEYRMINNPELAGQYRKSFRWYSEKSLLLSAFFYAMASTFFIGVFLIKYRIELIISMPFLFGLFCYYFYISYKEDSAAQKPEKLFRERGLMLFVVVVCVIITACLFIDIPGLEWLLGDNLIAF